MKIIAFTCGPLEGASSRLRVYQYVPLLKDYGIKLTVSPAVPSWLYNKFPPAKGIFSKLLYFGFGGIARTFGLFKVPFYDQIIVQKLFLPYIFPLPEILICVMAKFFNKKVIFDFDDSTIFINRSGKLFQDSNRLKRILRYCDLVIAGNDYLANYALSVCNNVIKHPTPVDISKWKPKWDNFEKTGPIIIGWIGGEGSAPYLNFIKNVLKRLSGEVDIIFRTVGIKPFQLPGVIVENWNWDLKTEVENVQTFDIGVMPVPNNEEGRGKCGLKLLQYLACGIPCVASPVGINCEIITNGYNGYLASNEEEWYKYLKKLVLDSNLRQRIGSNGRKTVEERYSLERLTAIYANELKTLGN